MVTSAAAIQALEIQHTNSFNEAICASLDTVHSYIEWHQMTPVLFAAVRLKSLYNYQGSYRETFDY